MALWMNRAGRQGESEKAFLQDGRIYLQWEEIDQNLGRLEHRDQLRELLVLKYPNAPAGRIASFLGQLWIFAKVMKPGDWVGLPSKLKRVIHFGEITGPYVYDHQQTDPRLRQYRTVNWFAPDVLRSKIPQDILYSFGPPTICGISNNNAEDRIRKMAASGWKAESVGGLTTLTDTNGSDVEVAEVDLEESARDQIAKLIASKFKGHGMAALVEAVLRAQGYTTYRSPEGPDYGIDIMAAPGSLGFGQPRLVVQVKSSDSPTDRPTVDQLIGTMQNVHADQGLFVSWGGFKSSVEKEIARQFFRVRLWDQRALIDQILAYYDQLDEDIKVELPLKRIWTIAQADDSETDE